MPLRGQNAHFVNNKRIPQHAKIRFTAESATLLLFFDLLKRFKFKNKQVRHFIIKKVSILTNPQQHLRNMEQFVESRNK